MAIAPVTMAQTNTSTATRCTGDTTDLNNVPSVLQDNLYVPAGDTCRLYGNTINGRVTVGGHLQTFGLTVDGNVDSNGGCFKGVTIDGHLVIQNSAGDPYAGENGI